MQDSIADRIQSVRRQIQSAALAAGRDPDAIHLLAVSKRHPPEAIIAALDAGVQDFGENYVQEGVDKIRKLQSLRPDAKAVWHFIGPLQSNKTRPVAEVFDWLHTLDRPKIAQRLAEQRPDDRVPLNVCIQVNIDNSSSKAGVQPEAISDLIRVCEQLPRLQLRGLMTVPDPADPAISTDHFRRMAEYFRYWKERIEGFDTLSMGMSGDLELAVAQGSTLLRIGTAVFGQRPEN